MAESSIVATLFELAIRSEYASREFYEGLAALFAQEPEVAAFCSHYARQESGHTVWLERLQAKPAPQALMQPANAHMLTAAQKLFRFSPAELLARVSTLENAYPLAVELESSETNTLFDFLISHYASDPETHVFLRAQLSNHIAHLESGFPTRIRNAALRSSLRAQRAV